MNRDRTLLINFSKNIPEVSNAYDYKYYYQIGLLNNLPNNKICVNNDVRLDEIAFLEKNDYSDWIYLINKSFLKRKLILNNDLSLFFLTDLSNKRSEIFDTYNNICNIILLSQIVNQFGITRIIINEANEIFVSSIKSYFNLEIFVFNKKVRIKSIKDKIIFNTLRHINLIIKYFLYRIFLFPLICNIKNKRYLCNTIFFTRYPSHFLKNTYEEEKYGNMVKSEDKFLTNLNADGLHQSLNIFKSLISRMEIQNGNSSQHIVLDDYVTFDNLFESIKDIFRFFIPFKRISDDKFIYKNIDISLSIRRECNLSFQRILGVLICYRALNKLLKNIDSERFIFYLHEFAFGRMMTYTLYRNKKLNIFGMQHGTPSKRKLCFNLSSEEIPKSKNNYLEKVPIPSKIIVEDYKSKNLYKDFGYKKIIVFSEVPRLHYLRKVKLKLKREKILIIPGLHDFLMIYNYVLEIIKNNPDQIYYLKPHPRSKIKFSKFKFPRNLQITNRNIYELLGEAKLVYVSYSSVGYEAKSLNIPVIEIRSQGIINESGLND